MKSLKIFAMAAIMVVCMTSWAGAMPVSGFWVYDSDSNGTVDLSLYDVAPMGGTLQYSTNGGSSWLSLTNFVNSTITLNPTAGASQLIQFQFLLNGNSYSGNVDFGGVDGAGLWHSATLNFYSGSQWYAYLIGTAGGLDHVGGPPASTPIPAAAWLLGSGLLGLIGIGGRRNYLSRA
jgi:hypothetical protein